MLGFAQLHHFFPRAGGGASRNETDRTRNDFAKIGQHR